VSKVTAAATALQRAGFLLDEDVQAYVKKAEDSPVGK
jgi:hypothetical protein